MTIANTNVIAKVAAVVAGLGLVATSFAIPARAATTAELEAQIAALQAQLGGSTTASACTFTRDLTVGSQGADVTCLQTQLAAKGYFTVAPTGYFGTVTQAAVAKWQAASGITPAAGYFGPISRAKFAAMGGSTGGSTGGNTGGSTGGSLSGGEADLSDFDLRRETADVDEAEEEVEVATAEFDVNDADVEVQRVEVEFQAASTSLSVRPWDYIESVSILDADGDELASMDTDSRADWDEDDDDSEHGASSADYYTLTFTGLDYVVEEGDTAELTIAVTGASNIDSDDLAQTFRVTIADDGIRAVDGEGIQQYVGEDSDFVSFGFGEEESGDLSIEESDDSADATTLIADEDEESDEYSVFTFDIENDQDVDTLVTDITIDVATSSGVSLENVIRRATLSVDGDELDGDINADGTITFEDVDVEIAGDDSMTFELMITLVRDASDTTLVFSIDEDGVEAEGVESGDESDVGGSAESETHTVATTGLSLDVEGTPVASRVFNLDTTSTDDQGEYVFELEVTAVEETAYVALSGAVSTSTTASTAGVYAYIENSSNTAVFTGTTTVTVERVSGGSIVSGNYVRINDGQTATLRVTVTYDAATTGQYRAQIHAVNFNDTAAAGDDQQLAVPEEDFQSPSVQVLN